MKRINSLLLFCCLCLFATTIKAEVITWIGGIGYWEDGGNWDTGNVPEIGDGVIINNGIVTIESYAEANYIHLDGGDLVVTGVLFMTPNINWYGVNSDLIRGIAIENGSKFDNYGSTVIIQPDNISGLSSLIFCNGEMINHTNGFIFCQGDQSVGIHIYSFANTAENYGDIILNGTQFGLFLINPFSNFGHIEIYSDDFALLNRELFYSGSTSSLIVEGRIINESTAIWNQYGSVEVHYTSSSNASAFSIAGTFEIQNGGSLLVDGSHAPVSVDPNSTFRIRGNLEIDNERMFAYALINEGLLVNHQNGVVKTSGYYGVFNTSGAQMLNYGIWNIKDDQESFFCTLWNLGSFSNRPKGKLYVEGRLNLKSGSTFNNQGHMFVLDDLAHQDLSGQFNNTAALNDIYNRMSSLSNTSIRVHKLAGPFTEGVPVPNVLDKGSNPGATVLGWYTTDTGNTLAGTYNSATNTFTPNANAVGLSTLLVRIRINSGSVALRHKLIVENGINANPSPIQQPKQPNSSFTNSSLTVAPNPMSSHFSINVENAENSESSFLNYAIYSSAGQREAFGIFDIASNSIEVPQHLPSGLYMLNVTDQEGRQIDTRQIRIAR